MTSMSREQIAGFEYDWLACDAAGHVALFSTAGSGHAPEEFLRDPDAHDAAIAAILAHPSSTTAKVAPAIAPGLTNTWKMVAERGLYAFDGDPSGGPYRLVAAPDRPVRVTSMPAQVAEVVSRLALPLRFAEMKPGAQVASGEAPRNEAGTLELRDEG